MVRIQNIISILLLSGLPKNTSFFHSKNVKFTSNKMFMKKSSHIQQPQYQNTYLPKTYNQGLYVDYLNNKNNDLIFAIGPAGSGKTMFACITAIELLRKNNIQKIIITRPVVPVEEDIGFLPGSIVKKMDPWTRPIFDLFLEYYSQNEINTMINNGVIEISPLAYMRGRTFKNAFIIADEMQNSSPNQMMMLTTRIGTDSRMVITGDLAQSDKLYDNGLRDFITKYNYYDKNMNQTLSLCNNNSIKIIELNNSDIMRSVIVEKVLHIYDYNVKYNKPDLIKNTTNVYNKTKIYTNVIFNKSNRNDNDAALIPKNHQDIILRHLQPGF
jgi:phosphate starvation-inducible PhoH-like protein